MQEFKDFGKSNYKVEEIKSLMSCVTSVDGGLMVNLNSLSPIIRDDIKEYCIENKKERSLNRYDGYMNLEDALNYYLEWNGISGYTSLIMSIIQQATICRIDLMVD